jgi:hypothetical protein
MIEYALKLPCSDRFRKQITSVYCLFQQNMLGFLAVSAKQSTNSVVQMLFTPEIKGLFSFCSALSLFL